MDIGIFSKYLVTNLLTDTRKKEFPKPYSRRVSPELYDFFKDGSWPKLASSRCSLLALCF